MPQAHKWFSLAWLPSNRYNNWSNKRCRKANNELTSMEIHVEYLVTAEPTGGMGLIGKTVEEISQRPIELVFSLPSNQRVASKPTHAKPIKLPYSVGRGFG